MKVNLFIPCYLDQVYPEAAISTVNVLEKFGVSVEYDKEQTCCGWPAHCNGYWNHSWEIGEKFVKLFNKGTFIVAPSPMCVNYVRNHLGHLFENSSIHNHYKAVASSLFELSEFMALKLPLPYLSVDEGQEILFIDSCMGLNECGIYEQPRILLNMVDGLEVRSIDQESGCCGFNANLPNKHPVVAAKMAMELCKRIESSGVNTLVFSEASCLMYLRQVQPDFFRERKALHLAEFLDKYVSVSKEAMVERDGKGL